MHYTQCIKPQVVSFTNINNNTDNIGTLEPDLQHSLIPPII